MYKDVKQINATCLLKCHNHSLPSLAIKTARRSGVKRLDFVYTSGPHCGREHLGIPTHPVSCLCLPGCVSALRERKKETQLNRRPQRSVD